MKLLYFDCQMGAAGDMINSALYELLTDSEKDFYMWAMKGLGLHGVTVEAEKVSKMGILGTHMSVKVHGEEECEDAHEHHHEHEHHHDHEHDHEHHHDHDHEHEHHHDHHHDHDHEHEHEHHHDHHHDHDHEHHHHHASMHDVEHIIRSLKVADSVKNDAIAIYGLIAEAESEAHGVPVSEIHFHEVGTLDAIADVVGACLLMNIIGAGKIMASPVHVGKGSVRCAHGILPVPAPATAHILRGVPMYSADIDGELCTPTGAAILKYYVKDFAEMPIIRTTAVGYGMGRKDFARLNAVRAVLGESEELSDKIIELNCNIDDMTGEDLGAASQAIMDAGARDVFVIPVQMKKNRPGFLLTVICTETDKVRMAEAIFKHTTTIGIRETVCSRYVLDRKEIRKKTPFGEIRYKVSEGYGVKREKPEFADIEAAAKTNGLSSLEVRSRLS